jgi:hypothetical protein
MKRKLICLALVASTSFVWAVRADENSGQPDDNRTPTTAKATSAADKVTTTVPATSPIESEIEQLRDLVEEQSEELQTIRARLASMEKKTSTVNSTPANSNSTKSALASQPTPADAAESHEDSGDAGSTGNQSEEPAPLSVKIGSARFIPGGFLDLAAFFRTTNVGSGIATSFGSIPFNNQLPQAALTETRFSSQYSRLSLAVDADLTPSTSVTGYVESDFLGYEPANAYVTANSDSLRLRLFFASVKHGKWEVLGGQSWSLLTPNRVGLSPMPADIFYTLNEDPNFQVGLIWARQPQFRVMYHPTSFWAIGLSLENPQQYAPDSVVFPTTYFSSQFDNGSGSTSATSSASNTDVPNLHPDIVVKTAFDWEPWGHDLHLEAAGLVRSFRISNDLTTPTSTNTITGGGGSVNLNFEVVKNLRLIANSFYSDGGGRYVFGLGPDAIVKPNGTLSGVHSGSGLAGFEWQATPRYMLYSYYGAAYFERNFGLLGATPASSCAGTLGFTCVGFGFPGSANSSNRAIQEGTFGVIPTLWSSPNFGKIQIITQYSYLVRSPWSIPDVTSGPNPKNAHVSMVYGSFRYLLP